MAGRGPAPKPAGLRQRRNKKPGAKTLRPASKQSKGGGARVPTLLNPDKRRWHRLTRVWWRHVWQSPMAAEYLETDVDGLARLAILVDDYYNAPDRQTLGEIRLQEARFGLSPVDRSRLAWEMEKADELERKKAAKKRTPAMGRIDPRDVLEMRN